MAIKYQRIVIDQDICIGCAACVAVCPHQALEMSKDNKAFMIWEKCKDAFDCIPVCPVNCIWKSSEAPDTAREKPWYMFDRELNEEEKQEFEEWKNKFKIKSGPKNFR